MTYLESGQKTGPIQRKSHPLEKVVREPPSTAAGAKMEQMATGTKMEQIVAGAKMEQMATGTKMEQMAAGTKMEQMAAGTKMEQIAAGTKMEQEMSNMADRTLTWEPFASQHSIHRSIRPSLSMSIRDQVSRWTFFDHLGDGESSSTEPDDSSDLSADLADAESPGGVPPSVDRFRDAIALFVADLMPDDLTLFQLVQENLPGYSARHGTQLAEHLDRSVKTIASACRDQLLARPETKAMEETLMAADKAQQQKKWDKLICPAMTAEMRLLGDPKHKIAKTVRKANRHTERNLAVLQSKEAELEGDVAKKTAELQGLMGLSENLVEGTELVAAAMHPAGQTSGIYQAVLKELLEQDESSSVIEIAYTDSNENV
ncbi:hypothetical protein BV898_06200 [Hypsibius exemplaris]|uniref:Uncharacterized protein n=1 Tax=Hypsibius exemplaris TaxID=2072580 RepID=A0A1W0WXP7_HYPEX|nr:hypothetical protein BV898_06200 [Hypsibius exemplaris]